MSLDVTVRRTGGSLTIAIPKTVTTQLGLSESDVLKMEVDSHLHRLVLTPAVTEHQDLPDDPELLTLIAEIHASVARTREAVNVALAPLPTQKTVDEDRVREEVRSAITDEMADEILDTLAAHAAGKAA
jgi:antitoxin component of MazEF toxin-antitoxin module